MSTLINAPLVEAVFELKWGRESENSFQYSQEEKQFFPGQINVAAAKEGYSIVMPLLKGGPIDLPQVLSHRFLTAENTWPCIQLGLGAFTVNQTNDGYDWESFKSAINQGLQIFNEADSRKFNSILNTASVALLYQDAFYPDDVESIEAYLETNFHVITKLPDSFLASTDISDSLSSISMNFTIPSIKPQGVVQIMIAHALVDGNPGLIMRTTVESKLATIFADDDFIGSIMNWSEEAHDMQRHSFKTLINPIAYKSEK